LYDLSTKKLKNRITSGNWLVRKIMHIDYINREIIFTAGGREKGNPYHIYLYKINFDGNKLIVIGSNGSVKLLDVNPKYWAKKACAIVNRNFTQEEWQKYMGNRPHEKTCPNLPKDTLGAMKLIRQSSTLIQKDKIEQAKSKLKKAHTLDPNFKIYIKIVNIFINKGDKLAQQGKIKQAIDNYTDAQDYDYKNKFAYTWKTLCWFGTVSGHFNEVKQVCEKAIAMKHNNISVSWNSLCWYGSVYGYFNEVKEACETAVTLEPENRWNRRARGLNKALIGDTQGAILDFQFFVDATKNNNSKLHQQLNAKPKKDNPFTMQLQEQRWLDILQQGKNPFTSEEIEKLKK
jgi:tetratricopeptide (TPR) repeat protein